MNPTSYKCLLGGLFLTACIVRLLLVRSRLSAASVFGLFVGAVILSLPVFYALSPNWHNKLVASPLLIYVGEPLGIYAVPFASQLFDLFNRSSARTRPVFPQEAVRIFFEILFAVIVWGYVWQVLMMLLGWTWV